MKRMNVLYCPTCFAWVEEGGELPASWVLGDLAAGEAPMHGCRRRDHLGGGRGRYGHIEDQDGESVLVTEGEAAPGCVAILPEVAGLAVAEALAQTPESLADGLAFGARMVGKGIGEAYDTPERPRDFPHQWRCPVRRDGAECVAIACRMGVVVGDRRDHSGFFTVPEAAWLEAVLTGEVPYADIRGRRITRVRPFVLTRGTP